MNPTAPRTSDPLVLEVARALARAHVRRDIAEAQKELPRANTDLRPI